MSEQLTVIEKLAPASDDIIDAEFVAYYDTDPLTLLCIKAYQKQLKDDQPGEIINLVA